jgi:small subunit ribosomal protein S1
MAQAQSNAEIIAAEPGVWTEIDGELVPDYDSTLTPFAEGDVVTGKVVRVDKDEILVDIGYKSEGVIPISELSIRRNVDPDEEVALGDEVDALVMQKEDADGRLILSKKRARFEKAWKRIEAAAESGEPVEGAVIEVVKGGLILDLGVRGFLPASLVDIRRVQDLDEYLHKTLRCRVIELNRSRNNVVLSRRAVLEEERREVRQRILDTLDTGSVVEGVISNIVDFGAFVDLDGIDGLIHISELSWSHVNHPSEVLEIGQKVRVKVLDIDRDRQRISLGLKQTQADPWQQVLDAYQQGDVVHGRVTKVVTFGAFVEIVPGVEGLVHISELANHHVENPREVVSQGQDVLVKVIEIDAERRRLSLSLKRVTEEDEVRPRLVLQGPAGAPPSEAPAAEAAEDEGETPNLGLSADVFGEERASDQAEEAEPAAELGSVALRDADEDEEPAAAETAEEPEASAAAPAEVEDADEAPAAEVEEAEVADEAPAEVEEPEEAPAAEAGVADEAPAEVEEPEEAPAAEVGVADEAPAEVDEPEEAPAAEAVVAQEPAPEAGEAATAEAEAPLAEPPADVTAEADAEEPEASAEEDDDTGEADAVTDDENAKA